MKQIRLLATLLIIMLCAGLTACSDDSEDVVKYGVLKDGKMTVKLESAGTLPSLITEDDKYKITRLTLMGNLNGTDIRFIREMAGRGVTGYETLGQLSVLDISGTNIVRGDNYYCKRDNYTYRSSENSIGIFMFQETRLTSILLPKSVTLIETSAFIRCRRLTSITIPDSVTKIGANAFYECSELTSVTIPNSVTSIIECAFYNCSKLKKVYNNSSTPQKINSNVFSGSAITKCTLYVPKGAKSNYLEVPVWKDFGSIIEL